MHLYTDKDSLEYLGCPQYLLEYHLSINEGFEKASTDLYFQLEAAISKIYNTPCVPYELIDV